MHWSSMIGVAMGALIVLFPVAFVSCLNVGGLYQILKRASNQKEKDSSLVENSPISVCATDAGCPSGYICLNGKRILQES